MDEILLGRINDVAQDVFGSIHKSKPFIPGETPIPVNSCCHDGFWRVLADCGSLYRRV
jgi:hypothetical protein